MHHCDLMIRGVSARYDRRNPRHNLGVARERFERCANGLKAISHVTISGVQAFVLRMPRDLDFAALDENARSRESRFERSRFAPLHDSAAMVEMQMREDHVRDIAGLHSERLQPVDQPAIAMIENLALDRAKPIADSGIDQD